VSFGLRYRSGRWTAGSWQLAAYAARPRPAWQLSHSPTATPPRRLLRLLLRAQQSTRPSSGAGCKAVTTPREAWQRIEGWWQSGAPRKASPWTAPSGAVGCRSAGGCAQHCAPLQHWLVPCTRRGKVASPLPVQQRTCPVFHDRGVHVTSVPPDSLSGATVRTNSVASNRSLSPIRKVME
jgi:hypothetical protein